MSFKSSLYILLLFISALSLNAFACEKNESYVIGVQSIDYSPHYNFIEQGAPSYFSLFLNWLEQKTSCKFSVKVLPIKRLNYSKNSQYSLDFIYPDNSTWHIENSDDRFYSDPIITAMTGMMVRPKEQKMPLEHFKVLAITRGFTPTQWLSLAPKHQIKFQETFNALASLKMVIYNRADGADVEFNVANYLTKKINFHRWF